MPAAYIDHDVAFGVAILCRQHGLPAVSVRERHQSQLPDWEHLLTASRRGAFLISHNRKDYRLLHGAWLRWSREWGAPTQHAGILIPQQGLPRQTFDAVLALLAEGTPLTNRMFEWRRGSGWHEFLP